MEAQEYISTCNCPDYLQRAEARLREEAERVQNYLDSISEPKITSVVETELILHQVFSNSILTLSACFQPYKEGASEFFPLHPLSERPLLVHGNVATIPIAARARLRLPDSSTGCLARVCL